MLTKSDEGHLQLMAAEQRQYPRRKTGDGR